MAGLAGIVSLFPPDRIETWRYEMELPADDAKEQVLPDSCLAPFRHEPRATPSTACASISSPALRVGLERNVTLECLT